MSVIKTEAMRMIDRLPDDCNWENVVYRFYVRAMIERGLAEADAGLAIPNDQVMREVEEWLASLGQPMPAPTSSDT